MYNFCTYCGTQKPERYIGFITPVPEQSLRPPNVTMYVTVDGVNFVTTPNVNTWSQKKIYINITYHMTSRLGVK